MLGRDHALSGAAAWLAAAPLVERFAHDPLGPVGLAVGAVVTAGAAVLPDLDEPRSNPARALGVASQAVSVGVGAVAGGHRRATHSVLAVVLAGAGAEWALVEGRVGTAVLVGVLVLLGVHLLGPRTVRRHTLLGAAIGAAAGWLAWRNHFGGEWLIWAVTGGVVVHILGDALTHGGVPILWPAKPRVGLHLFRTGGALESVVGVALGVLVVWLAWLRLHTGA